MSTVTAGATCYWLAWLLPLRSFLPMPTPADLPAYHVWFLLDRRPLSVSCSACTPSPYLSGKLTATTPLSWYFPGWTTKKDAVIIAQLILKSAKSRDRPQASLLLGHLVQTAVSGLCGIKYGHLKYPSLRHWNTDHQRHP